jgi:hypothetical protein
LQTTRAPHLVFATLSRKLREDQRAAKADVALIVSHALPKGLQTFDQIDGVWVTEPRCAVAVAH